jgi:hypothetical protein
MAMFWDGLGTLLSRLCVSGPLLYIGLVMTTAPRDLFAMFVALSQFPRLLDRRSRTLPPSAVGASPTFELIVRIAGLALCSIALLALTGLAG